MKLEKNSIYLRSEQLKDFKAFMESETHTESHLYINNDLVFKIFKNSEKESILLFAITKNYDLAINFLENLEKIELSLLIASHILIQAR